MRQRQCPERPDPRVQGGTGAWAGDRCGPERVRAVGVGTTVRNRVKKLNGVGLIERLNY